MKNVRTPQGGFFLTHNPLLPAYYFRKELYSADWPKPTICLIIMTIWCITFSRFLVCILSLLVWCF